MARSGEHYMPRQDADFSAWADQYYDAVSTWWTANGLDPADLSPLKAALVRWQTDFPAHAAAQAAAQGARQAKDAARAGLEQQVRPITNFIQTSFKTSNPDRARMGITLRDASPSRAPAPTTRPVALVTCGTRLTHQLRIVDQSTPTRRARPRGVDRAEVFVLLTPPGQPAPANPGDYRYIGSVTRGETTLSFEPAKGGMQAHYVARWVATSGAIGPWSETASATVAA